LLLFFLLLSYASTSAAQSIGTFKPTGRMTTPRGGHTATLLLNGKVLITGGSAASGSSAELYDPATGTFSAVSDMTIARYGHTATLLPDGKVLITGGAYGPPHPGMPIVFPDGTVFTPMVVDALPNTELYDPSSGTFTRTGDMVVAPWYGQTATLLNNGKVLIAGGGRGCPNGNDGCAIVDTTLNSMTP
jgi:Kelch motif/Galactose oxidase, central domain